MSYLFRIVMKQGIFVFFDFLFFFGIVLAQYFFFLSFSSPENQSKESTDKSLKASSFPPTLRSIPLPLPTPPHKPKTPMTKLSKTEAASYTNPNASSETKKPAAKKQKERRWIQITLKNFFLLKKRCILFSFSPGQPSKTKTSLL